MEDIYYTLGELVDLWKLPTSSGFESESVVATEFWLQKATNTIKVKTRKIGPEARERWLDERTKGSGEDEQSLLVRFVWLVADNNRNEITLSQSIRHILLERFGLRLAGEYFKTLSSGVADLPPVSKPEFDQRAYTFSYGPKIAAIWSHSIFKGSSAGESVTEGLIFTRGRSEDPSKNSKQKSKPGKDPLQELQGFLQRAPWKPELCRSSAFPAYLFSIMLSRQMTETQTEIAGSIRQVESRTGHHKYANREDHDENHLGKLSASTSGYASKLASVMRKGQVVQKLLDFIKKTVNEEAALEERYGTHSGDGEPNFGTGSLLKANVEVLQDRLEMQRVEVEHTLKRVEIQIEALFQLISQGDSINNLRLALETKAISETSQRDAASMKTLAVVTMFFLPGSFISALFSTPMFDWDNVDLTMRDSIGVPLTPQFRLYWSVTVPLTLVTFILYFLWLWYQAQEQHKAEEKRNKQLELGTAKVFESKKFEGVTEVEKQERARRVTVVDEEVGVVEPWKKTF